MLEYSGPFVAVEEDTTWYELAQPGGEWHNTILAGEEPVTSVRA